jgi:AraC-like DNA-binding protein
MNGLVRSASLTNFAEIARATGLDPSRMLSAAGLPPSCFADPEVLVPIDAVRQLLEDAAARSGVEAFGLLMAETRKLSNLGPIGLLIREQPTLRHALELLVRHSRNLNAALFMTLEEAGDLVVLREEIIVGGSGAVRQSTELAIGVVFRMLRAFLGPDWRPQRVCFAHDAPADVSAHERLFGRAVEFGHDFNGIVFRKRDLEAHNPDADPASARYVQKLVDAGAPAQHAAMSARVHEQVVLLLGTSRCSIDVVAQHLGVDRRTVHRRLATESSSYSAIVDQVRRELASRYLERSGRPLTEVSAMLGFSAPSGFSRWYKRQFGNTATRARSENATAKRGPSRGRKPKHR